MRQRAKRAEEEKEETLVLLIISYLGGLQDLEWQEKSKDTTGFGQVGI